MAGTETTPTTTMTTTPSVPPTQTSTEVDYLSRMTLQIVTLTPTPMSTLRPKRLTLSPTFWLVCCWRPS